MVASTVEERRLLQTQRSFAVVRDLAARAVAAFVGVGNIGWQSPMHRDHFVTDQEITELIDEGAVGEIAGWAYDSAGRLVDSATNERNAGLPLTNSAAYADDRGQRQPERVVAISAALRGGLLGGLITDERTALRSRAHPNKP